MILGKVSKGEDSQKTDYAHVGKVTSGTVSLKKKMSGVTVLGPFGL